MNRLKVCSLTVLFSILVCMPKSRAATMQVDQVVNWFTGLFQNTSQVEENPFFPLITMNNCQVQVVGAEIPGKSVYLQQETDGFPFRIRYYEFKPLEDGVNLSIYFFKDESSLVGLCQRPPSERSLDFNKINFRESCDIFLRLEVASFSYLGNNAPDGCPRSSGGKVVSDISLQANRILSLDKIFDEEGELEFGTEIDFRRVNVPESRSTVVLLAFAAVLLASLFNR